MLESVCVFCGSASGANARYGNAAQELGAAIAGEGLRLIYGGSNVGLMGILADAALAAGGAVTGVIPQGLVEREVAHRGLTELRVVQSMHERKAMMADLAGAFVAMPGGYGTLDELCEVLTWAQLGIHRKPVALLNTERYWDPFLGFLDHGVGAGFLKPAHRRLVEVYESPIDLVAGLQRLAKTPPELPSKWSLPDR